MAPSFRSPPKTASGAGRSASRFPRAATTSSASSTPTATCGSMATASSPQATRAMSWPSTPPPGASSGAWRLRATMASTRVSAISTSVPTKATWSPCATTATKSSGPMTTSPTAPSPGREPSAITSRWPISRATCICFPKSTAASSAAPASTATASAPICSPPPAACSYSATAAR